MHNYLNAAGFSEYNTEGTVYRLIRNRVLRPEYMTARLDLGDGTVLLEYRMPVNPFVGICAGLIFGNGEFSELQYYYPYSDSPEVSTNAECTVERHTMEETYSGVIEAYNIDLSLIFFMSNPVSYRLRMANDPVNSFKGTSLSAFSNKATVLLPVVPQDDPLDPLMGMDMKDPEAEFDIPPEEEDSADSIDALTESDLRMFHQISERIESEDLYSLVDQSFMPCGVECDLYSVIGEIKEIKDSVNELTGEALSFIKLSCNEVEFRMCIRKDDILGEPLVGRRLKCSIWMTGRVNVEF